MKGLVNWLLLAVVVIGVGYPPSYATGVQATLMARRAAIESCYVQLNQQGVVYHTSRIIDECDNSTGKYTITMEAK